MRIMKGSGKRWRRLARRWLHGSGLPQAARLREDVGLAPLPEPRVISPLVLAWLH